jgi:hypothetical protein
VAAFNKFNSWVEVWSEAANLGTDQFTIALSNVAPAAANSVLADITEISYANCSSRNVTTTSSSQAAGTYTLVLTDLTLTATGAVGPFTYVILYDSTIAGGALVGWWVDPAGPVTMANTNTYLIDFQGATLTKGP